MVELRSAQDEVTSWAIKVFGARLVYDKRHRSLRFLEEALELVQACGLDKIDALKVMSQVYAKPAEKVIAKEVAGSFTTLMALSSCLSIDFEGAYEDEMSYRHNNVELIRKKNQEKVQ